MDKEGGPLFWQFYLLSGLHLQKNESDQPFFVSDCRFALDWDHLITMAEEPGRFICVEKPLMYHRLHQDAATNACMRDSLRFREEKQMFGRIWPEPIVRLLMRFYQRAYQSYE